MESIEEAEKKIDDLAANGGLDPALLLTMAKAYSGVKESQFTKEEVKDVMYHLYTKAKEKAARQAPKEVRILKHLLSIDDPQQRRAELESAFQPVRPLGGLALLLLPFRCAVVPPAFHHHVLQPCLSRIPFWRPLHPMLLSVARHTMIVNTIP